MVRGGGRRPGLAVALTGAPIEASIGAVALTVAWSGTSIGAVAVTAAWTGTSIGAVALARAARPVLGLTMAGDRTCHVVGG